VKKALIKEGAKKKKIRMGEKREAFKGWWECPGKFGS